MRYRWAALVIGTAGLAALAAEPVRPPATGSEATTQAAKPVDGNATSQPAPKGVRVFTCGHSFHAAWLPEWLSRVAQAAGIQGHEIVGVSMIGGSRVIQHWDVPDEKNKAKAALRDGKVDVLTLSPMHQADDGLDKFAELALQGNPNIRVTAQEFWIPFDKNEWPFKGDQKAVNPDAATSEFLHALHDPYFKAMDEYIAGLNARLASPGRSPETGKQVVFVVPVGQAVLALREKIIAGKAPGIEKQSDLFTDKLGHPRPPIQALAAYCHYAVIYHRNPVGLKLAIGEYPEELNRLLQELAWDAVIRHPLSGVKSQAAGDDASK